MGTSRDDVKLGMRVDRCEGGLLNKLQVGHIFFLHLVVLGKQRTRAVGRFKMLGAHLSLGPPIGIPKIGQVGTAHSPGALIPSDPVQVADSILAEPLSE